MFLLDSSKPRPVWQIDQSEVILGFYNVLEVRPLPDRGVQYGDLSVHAGQEVGDVLPGRVKHWNVKRQDTVKLVYINTILGTNITWPLYTGDLYMQGQ